MESCFEDVLELYIQGECLVDDRQKFIQRLFLVRIRFLTDSVCNYFFGFLEKFLKEVFRMFNISPDES